MHFADLFDVFQSPAVMFPSLLALYISFTVSLGRRFIWRPGRMLMAWLRTTALLHLRRNNFCSPGVNAGELPCYSWGPTISVPTRMTPETTVLCELRVLFWLLRSILFHQFSLKLCFPDGVCSQWSTKGLGFEVDEQLLISSYCHGASLTTVVISSHLGSKQHVKPPWMIWRLSKLFWTMQ